MKKFEEVVFLLVTNTQFEKFPGKRYYELVNSLSKKEEERFQKIYSDITNIWNMVNGFHPKQERMVEVNSIQEYHEKLKPLDEMILSVSEDFGLTLKRGEFSEKFRNSVISQLGKEFWDKTFGD